MEEMTYYQWQKEALDAGSKQDNMLVSAPTGSGKTRVFLEWAKSKNTEYIFLTAPLKSVSNQRYRDLMAAGENVAIETGDVKTDLNEERTPKFICMTQEIYTMKYKDIEDAVVILDEFHYIFENRERSRVYIDGVVESKARHMFICSGTFADPKRLQEYLERISGRTFYLYHTTKRVTKIRIQGKIQAKDIRNAMVIAFSGAGCEHAARTIARLRSEEKDIEKAERLETLASIFGVTVIPLYRKGVAVYTSSLQVATKLFIEEAFEQKLLDVVCGTDALSLGVNFPVERVVFTQLAKYIDGPISANQFQQIIGRAGRPGFYDVGYVNYWDCGNESRQYTLEELFRIKKNQRLEPMRIELDPDMEEILSGEKEVAQEARYIVKHELGGKKNEGMLMRSIRDNKIYVEGLLGKQANVAITNLLLDQGDMRSLYEQFWEKYGMAGEAAFEHLMSLAEEMIDASNPAERIKGLSKHTAKHDFRLFLNYELKEKYIGTESYTRKGSGKLLKAWRKRPAGRAYPLADEHIKDAVQAVLEFYLKVKPKMYAVVRARFLSCYFPEYTAKENVQALSGMDRNSLDWVDQSNMHDLLQARKYARDYNQNFGGFRENLYEELEVVIDEIDPLMLHPFKMFSMIESAKDV